MDEAMIRRIDDRTEISHMICRLALGMDLRDEAMFRACWADEFQLSVPALGAGAEPMVGRLKAVDHARNVIARLSEFKATQHVLTNHLIEVEGDTAQCCVYLVGTHIFADVDSGDPVHTIGARYEFECRRFPDGWKIVSLVWTRHWATGNEGLWQIAEQRAAAKLAAA
ncbi:MAG TPA: nuclear transport factor 2 family protein [Stellaceae bacterium]|nr:nuclear transport factor 2 family protein [Stellaceae bacterium]